jgi:hypothetical protein
VEILEKADKKRKIKIFKKSSFKRLTGACKFGIIDRLCNSALYGLTREVTEIQGRSPLTDNFRRQKWEHDSCD